jgi:hypothetical protein
LIPVPLIEHLSKVMPRNNNGEGYDYHSFLDGAVNGNGVNNEKASVEQLRVTGGMARGSKHYL